MMNTAMKRSETGRRPPGQVVLDELGLIETVDGLRGEFPKLSKSTVWRWAQTREDGGTDGLVPSQYHLPLLRLAKRMGCKLTADDLVLGRKS